MSAREAAQRLLARARAEQVRLPAVWDESTAMQNCGAILMVHRTGGEFNEDEALADLIAKYGRVASVASGSKRKSEEEDRDEKEHGDKEEEGHAHDGAAQSAGEEGSDHEKEGGKAAKKRKVAGVKKTEIVAREENRAIADAIQEMATIAFQNKDVRKGGVFAKAAKALRECEMPITTSKEAQTLKGIGKGIAGYIEEQLQTGSIKKLEEMRAGIA